MGLLASCVALCCQRTPPFPVPTAEEEPGHDSSSLAANRCNLTERRHKGSPASKG
ncbi:hypothetical protein I79_020136 [Cricetulus griseus]|uniref:Uncharacterized protein n=1 Tax=Cricetulus griseus TaxID=10029 RepID=G3I9A0_CRIGR|nr:hypothetical protein I79_020136 [Cricetulus griseus]